MTSVYDTIKLLKPYDIDIAKRRFGSKHDGGYIFADIFTPGQKIISYGLGTNVVFDYEMASNGHKIFMFDHTINALPMEHENFIYHKEGVAAKTDEAISLFSIEDHLARNAIDEDNLILKIDVEGAEWDVFSSIADETLNRFQQIAIEIHWLKRLNEIEFRQRVEAALSRLNKHFTLFHVHANNWSTINLIDGFLVADVLELSYIKTSLVNRSPSKTVYPTTLDYANWSDRCDYVLSFFPFLPTDTEYDIGQCAGRVLNPH